MAGIRDIARITGRSISTVSLALKGSHKVTEETKEEILKVAKELGYTPNLVAQSMRSGQTRIIGVYLGDYSGPVYGPLLKGMRESLSEKKYDLIACAGKQSRRLLLEKMLDGALILDASFSDEDILSSAELGHKIVLLDRPLIHENISTLLLDNAKGAKLAVENLVKHQVKKVFVVTGPKDSYDSQERLNAATRSLEAHPNLNVAYLLGDFTKESGVEAANQIFQDFNGPIAIFCLNDEMAVGVYNYLKETDYQIGKDVFIVGFDNIELASYIEPRLTTINYSTFEWGKLATDSLLNLLEGNPASHEILEVELIEGQSS